MSARLAGVALAALTVVMCVIGVVTLSPPAAVPADAPAAEFSAHRALGHLETIAREPHPVGSAAHAAVRSYITSELRALDVEPHLQSAVVGVEGSRVAASVVNVLARVEGTGSGKAVMLVGHYDSVPGSPGAGDDGAAVAAMLETLRAILAGPPLSNDVILLFTDAEELGLLGARAFVEQHTWLDDVGLVLNLESRGTRGVAHMFETSEGNGRLVPEFLRVAKYPAAQSISYEIYKIMPNDTDYSVFRRAGLRGLNFAFIEGGTGYHTAQDSLERLDPGSLQHIGDYALTLARHFGNADLERDWGSTDAVYFNLLGPFYVTYPASWVHPVALLLLLGTAGVLIRGLRAGCLSPGRLALGFVINLAGAAVVAGVMWWAADRVNRSYQFELWFGWASGSLTLLALLLVACGLTVAIHRLVAARFGGEHLLAGGWVIWTVLLIALGFTAPGATYLIALPLALSLAAGARWLRREPGRPPPARLLITLSLCIAVAALLWAPLVTLIGVALGEIAAVLGGAAIFLLLCGLLTPLLDLLRGPGRGWVLPVVLALLGVGLYGAVWAASVHGVENRRMSHILYTLDTASGDAQWVSIDREPGEWTSRFLTASPERGQTPQYLGFSEDALLAPAPKASLGAAEIRLVDVATSEDIRTLRLRVIWPFEADRTYVFLRSDGAVRSISTGGHTVKPVGGGRESDPDITLLYFAPPAEGLELIVSLAGDAPLEVEVVGHLPDLPVFADLPTVRPPHLMPREGWSSDSTYVRSVARFETAPRMPAQQ